MFRFNIIDDWKSKKKLPVFTQITHNHIIIIEYHIWLTLPYTLMKNRIHIVLSRSKCFNTIGNGITIHYCNSSDAVRIIKTHYKNKKVFIIGKAQTLFLEKAKNDPEHYTCEL